MAHTKQCDLKAKLVEAQTLVQVGGKYAHYRSPTDLYTVVQIAIREDSEEIEVVYHAEYGEGIT
jgi:hypothetical protein